ncbi:Phosphatidylinositide phosphatase SAC2 [Erysiphe neolycopersici]|uniref:Phosphatidylinositide phosphatase SAC2 n=1 Tax=Erysiphe neolycopersici TaxID=212602 RepID=A0A420HL74_9PEZI|nr:Phosphatidylinositide phosphatase SAC2 [Erysiphe neolycopersici]
MSSLVRKILIYAVTEGLILRPLPQKDGQTPSSPIKIFFNDNRIDQLPNGESEEQVPDKSFEAFGVVGLLTISKSSFLLSIVKREQVAQVYNKPIFVVTGIALTPLASKAEADSSIGKSQSQLSKHTETCDKLDSSDSEEDHDENNNQSVSTGQEVDDKEDIGYSPALISHRRTSSVAEDVMAKKGGYGRFANKWFSKTGWNLDQRRNMGMTSTEDGSFIKNNELSRVKIESEENKDANIAKNELLENKVGITENTLQKLLRTTQLLLGSSKSFYFSYDLDITRSILKLRIPCNDLALYKNSLTDYFWNFHLLKPFINAGQSSFCLPVMQGFVGQREFSLYLNPVEQVTNLDGLGSMSNKLSEWASKHRKSINRKLQNSDSLTRESTEIEITQKDFLLTLISRRSVRRAGLRYLRRGVDENGYTANFVETEQILSDPNWMPSRRLSSFIQIRGSIPVFWSQSPNSFKPTPRLQHGEETNLRAYRAHIKNITSTYGDIQAISLVEKNGSEAIVGVEYEKLVKSLNEENHQKADSDLVVGFEWWDFHANCRGLKFENVNLLVEILGEKLKFHNYSCILEGKIQSRQSGVMRTNCMDCLDRTNVTQSACARRILEMQLVNEDVDLAFHADKETEWFNNLWADNGDAISKQYASTAALKGDFTRTRKREFAGALKDMSLSISRFYNGIFNDYFSQAAIDYLLGNATELIFEDFDENFMTVDPAISMQRLRQKLIELCQKQVISEEKEEIIGGWTLLTPIPPNIISFAPLQESVLVITDAGLYSCHINWDLEKLSSFERISLESIQNIKYGAYITSTLSAAQMDEERNVGLVISYNVDDQKNNTNDIQDSICEDTSQQKSLVSSLAQVMPVNPGRAVAGVAPAAATINKKSQQTRMLVFKALPSRSSISVNAAEEEVGVHISELEQVEMICSEIERLVNNFRAIEVGHVRPVLLEHADIISLAEARKSTRLLDKLSHNFKKLVWG